MPNRIPKAKLTQKRTPKPRYSSYNSNDIIYSRKWKRVRQDHLSQYPICERCVYYNNVTRVSTEKMSVHHIKSRIKYRSLALDPDNLLTLCEPCHQYYTGLESSGRSSLAEKQANNIKQGVKHEDDIRGSKRAED